MNWSDLRHFTKQEFACNCGNCENKFKLQFAKILDEIRAEVSSPLIISSGYRCPDYNDQVSGSGRNGPHTTGLAADIAVWGAQAVLVLRAALAQPAITGLGISQKGDIDKRFIHLDAVEAKANRPRPHIWSY